MHVATNVYSLSDRESEKESNKKSLSDIIASGDGRFCGGIKVRFHGSLHDAVEKLAIERAAALKASTKKYSSPKKKVMKNPYSIITTNPGYVDAWWDVLQEYHGTMHTLV